MACFVDGNYSAKLLGLFDKLVERRTLGSRLIREVPPVSVEFAKELPDDDAPVQPPVTKRNPNAHFAREGKLRLVTRAQLAHSGGTTIRCHGRADQAGLR